jgi:ATP synthase F1 gamma subunit
MPNLKDLKNRIESVKSTRKITKAMQMVAAAKLRRAQDAAEQARPYAERFNAVMGALAASVGDVGRFERGLVTFLRSKKQDVLDWITNEDPKVKGDAADKIKAALDEYAADFA